MEISNPEKLLIQITSVLEKLKIKYFITGGFAVSVWGRPRATFDLDIVVQLIEPQILSLSKALRAISKAGYIDEDAAREAILRKGEFNFIDGESGLKVDFWHTKDAAYSKAQFERKICKVINSKKIYFISPEDLILSKLQWYKNSGSSRQLEDIESILKISGKKLDKKYLKQWAIRLNVLEILEKISDFGDAGEKKQKVACSFLACSLLGIDPKKPRN